MCAKLSKRRATPAAAPVPSDAAVAAGPTPASAPTAGAATPWLESADPRRRMIGQAVLWGVWLYVAALWLLALDQFFNWGIFGPKLPPLP